MQSNLLITDSSLGHTNSTSVLQTSPSYTQLTWSQKQKLRTVHLVQRDQNLDVFLGVALVVAQGSFPMMVTIIMISDSDDNDDNDDNDDDDEDDDGDYNDNP